MTIRKIISPDMQTAMRRVKNELGPEAIIMRSQMVPGGVEVTAHASEAMRSKPQRKPAVALNWSDLVKELKLETRAKSPSEAESPQTTEATEIQRMRDELSELRRLIEGPSGNARQRVPGQSGGETAQTNKTRAPVGKPAAPETDFESERIDFSVASRLERLGLGHQLCTAIAGRVRTVEPGRAWSAALSLISSNLKIDETNPIETGGVVALVGATGVGKTTTIAKLAARFVRIHGPRRLALVTTDNIRIGGSDQLRTFARALGSPVLCVSTAAELDSALAGLARKSLVLIDTAGMSPRDLRLSEHLAMLGNTPGRIRTYLVLSASMQESAMAATVRAFSHNPLAGCIVSKLDEAGSMGPLITTLLRSKLQVAYLANGPRVPEDFHKATAQRIMNISVSLASSTEREEARTTDLLAVGQGSRS